jgi:hypothetical protein
VLSQAGAYDGVFVTTTKGLRLTSPEARVRELYGRPSLVARDANSGGLEMVYRPRPKLAPARRYVFVTAPLGDGIRGRWVTEMTVGDMPEARYSEACS